MQRISENAWRLNASSLSHSFLLRTASGSWLLVDTGYPFGTRRLAKEILRATGTLDGILLTHHDFDHIGGIRAVQSQFHCPVYVHEQDIPFFFGTPKEPPSKNRTQKLAALWTHRPEDVRGLSDMPFPDVQWIWAPGHTPGHCVFHFEDVLLSGDMFSNRGKAGPSNLAQYHADLGTTAQSLRAIADLDVASFHPAHGDWVANTEETRMRLGALADALER